MTPAPGDLLIALRTTIDDRIAAGAVVTTSYVHGEYVSLDETGPATSYPIDGFVIAVRRPWWAWAEPEWEGRTRAVVRETVEAMRTGR